MSQKRGKDGLTGAQRRRARKKSNLKAKREYSQDLANAQAGGAILTEEEHAIASKSAQREVGTQMAVNAANKLKAKFARKREAGNASDRHS